MVNIFLAVRIFIDLTDLNVSKTLEVRACQEPSEKRERSCDRGKVREFCFISKSQCKFRDFVFNADFHENLLLFFLSIIDNFCQVIYKYESAHVNFLELFYCFQVLGLHQQNLKYNTVITWNSLFQTLEFV